MRQLPAVSLTALNDRPSTLTVTPEKSAKVVAQESWSTTVPVSVPVRGLVASPLHACVAAHSESTARGAATK
jgi:hypothetical protein